ncbi:MAG: hypothetical protein AB7J32_03470 [Pseudonocardia sp.]
MTRNGRIVLAVVMATIVLLAVMITWALAHPSPAPTPAAAPAGNSTPDPVITSFHMIAEFDCPGGTASVPAAWTTKDTTSVSFAVNGTALPNAAGYPVSGTAELPVPCDGKSHSVTLTAKDGAASVKRTVYVNTQLPTPPPPGAPDVTAFQILENVTCPAKEPLLVAAAWATTNATAVSFSIDGQPLPAAAGYPVTGAGKIPVPCDGGEHVVTLTAANAANQTSALSRPVNTTLAPPPVPPPTTTVTTTVTTVAPPTTVTVTPTDPDTPPVTTPVDPPTTPTTPDGDGG